jgi:hypothetical protein
VKSKLASFLSFVRVDLTKNFCCSKFDINNCTVNESWFELMVFNIQVIHRFLSLEAFLFLWW